MIFYSFLNNVDSTNEFINSWIATLLSIMKLFALIALLGSIILFLIYLARFSRATPQEKATLSSFLAFPNNLKWFSLSLAGLAIILFIVYSSLKGRML